MNNKTTRLLPLISLPRLLGGKARRRVVPESLALAVLALGACCLSGCYRSTGIQRNPMVAEVIPATAGDSVPGLKSKAGQGDYYLGNDFINLTIDSTVYEDPVRTPMAGAASGGSIVDAGYINLDASFARVGIPSTVMNRLTPVVNQDPGLPVVFRQYQMLNPGGIASLTMTGQVLDAGNKLGAGAGLVPGVTVSHTLAVAQLDRFFTITTIVTNNGSVRLPIQSVGDCLVQSGGGYAFNIPANFDYQGNALAARWGVQIPGSDFSAPLTNSVQASAVGLMSLEPGSHTVDAHASLGFLPVDADRLLVAADAQDLLTLPNRPEFPQRLAVGSLPVPYLDPGESITFHRRLFIVGGTSVATSVVGGSGLPISYPNQSTGLFNLMDMARYRDITIRPAQETGLLTFTLSGSSQRQGALPTEIRIERNVTAGVPGADPAGTWQVQRVEWSEPNENLGSTTTLAPSTLQVLLPVGFYRMILRNQNATQTRTLFDNINPVDNGANQNQINLPGPIWIQVNQNFVVDPNDVLSPDSANDAAGTSNLSGPVTNSVYSLHYFQTMEANGPYGSMQPLRFTFKGLNGAPDPVLRRQRTLGSYWDPYIGTPAVSPGIIPGQYQFRGGNEMFGAAFSRLLPAEFAWFPNGGTYTVYGQRGPLSQLLTATFATFNGNPDVNHNFVVTPMGLPPGWTSFDLPGPGQASTGGYLTGEKLSSATANGVQVVGNTEQDLAVDAPSVYTQWRDEYAYITVTENMIPASLSAINRPYDFPFGYDPFVVPGRTSTLDYSTPNASFGTVTALFTPRSTNAPLGGAPMPQPGQTWNLADFAAQSLGQYIVVHRPRAPQGNPQGDSAGLFVLQSAPVPAPPAPNNALGAWWRGWSTQTGPYAFGKTFQFDALELLRGASLPPYQPGVVPDPTAWFNEFLQVRSDWFGLLNYQSPSFFTKALGLSSAVFSLDTPVGLARTYLQANPTMEWDEFGNVAVQGVLAALQSGAAVASTGPFLDVNVGGAGPGQTAVAGPVASVTLAINLWRTDWLPVDEIRVIVDGVQALTVNPATLAPSGADPRLFTGQVQVPIPSNGKDSWIVVEAGVPLTATGPYTAVQNPLAPVWSAIMRGIYPIAVTNPIFVKVTSGNSYVPPLP